MYKKAKKAFIPAAIAWVGVEHAPGALPCQAGVSNNKACNPYDINFINAQTSKNDKTTKTQEDKNDNLYKRTSNQKREKLDNKEQYIGKVDLVDKQELPKEEIVLNNKTISNINKAEKLVSKNKQIVKKAKEINIPKVSTKSKDNKELEVSKKSNSTHKKEKLNSYTYVIAKGDTLAKLAIKFNTSVATLLKLNNLNEKDAIKVGAKILIPKNNLKVAKKATTKFIYKVEKGDTLAKIAKLTGVSVSKLIKYNHLDDHKIKVGQKIYLRANNLKKSTTVAKKTTTIKKGTKKLRQLKVTATAYTSHYGQTDKTPFLAAWNNRIRPGMKIIAVSRDLIKKYGLTNGVKVRIKGLPGYYTVRDKMNKRFKRKIDIYMGVNKRKALKWGKRKIVLMW